MKLSKKKKNNNNSGDFFNLIFLRISFIFLLDFENLFIYLCIYYVWTWVEDSNCQDNLLKKIIINKIICETE